MKPSTQLIGMLSCVILNQQTNVFFRLLFFVFCYNTLLQFLPIYAITYTGDRSLYEEMVTSLAITLPDSHYFYYTGPIFPILISYSMLGHRYVY
ncbi:hypothetical protein BDQ12DRAFT_675259, partial [Crucibulum laeve]